MSNKLGVFPVQNYRVLELVWAHKSLNNCLKLVWSGSHQKSGRCSDFGLISNNFRREKSDQRASSAVRAQTMFRAQISLIKDYLALELSDQRTLLSSAWTWESFLLIANNKLFSSYYQVICKLGLLGVKHNLYIRKANFGQQWPVWVNSLEPIYFLQGTVNVDVSAFHKTRWSDCGRWSSRERLTKNVSSNLCVSYYPFAPLNISLSSSYTHAKKTVDRIICTIIPSRVQFGSPSLIIIMRQPLI